MMNRLEKAVLIGSLAIALTTTIISTKTLLNPESYQPNSTRLKPEAHQLMKDYCPLSGASALLAVASAIPRKKRSYMLR